MSLREEIAHILESRYYGYEIADNILDDDIDKIISKIEKRIDTLIQCEAKRLNGLGLVEKTRDRYNDVNLSDEVIAKLNKLKEMLKN